MVEEEWLKILGSLASGVAVTDVADRHLTRKLSDSLLVKDLTYKSFTLDSMKGTFVVNGHDTTTLLTSAYMLVERVAWLDHRTGRSSAASMGRPAFMRLLTSALRRS